MNRHQGPFSLPTLSGILILVVTASAASIASAQATQSTGALGEAIKSSTDFNAITAAVDQFVTGQVQALAGADPVARSAARDALIDAAVPRGGGNASPTFLDVYARGLNDKIVPILGNENELIRLNAAIVVAKVAEKADNINLRDAVLALLKDKSPTVSLWALKAAKTVIIPVIRNPAFKGDQLLSGVVAATKAHGAGPLGGPVALDGYDALALDQSGAQPARRPNDKMNATVVPFVQQVLQERVTAYRNGIPPEPLAERVPVTFLTHVNVWKIQTPEQKLATIQGVSDLVSLAAEHMAKAEGLNREKLALVLGNAGQALQVVPELADIRAKIEPLGKVNQNTPPNDVAAAAGAVYDALKGHKLFAKLNAPPRVTAAAAGAGGDKEIVETTQPSGTTRPATTRAAAAPATQPKAPAPAAAPAGAAPKSPAPAAPAGGAKAPAAAPNAPAAPAPAPR